MVGKRNLGMFKYVKFTICASALVKKKKNNYTQMHLNKRRELLKEKYEADDEQINVNLNKIINRYWIKFYAGVNKDS